MFVNVDLQIVPSVFLACDADHMPHGVVTRSGSVVVSVACPWSYVLSPGPTPVLSVGGVVGRVLRVPAAAGVVAPVAPAFSVSYLRSPGFPRGRPSAACWLSVMGCLHRRIFALLDSELLGSPAIDLGVDVACRPRCNKGPSPAPLGR